MITIHITCLIKLNHFINHFNKRGSPVWLIAQVLLVLIGNAFILQCRVAKLHSLLTNTFEDNCC